LHVDFGIERFFVSVARQLRPDPDLGAWRRSGGRLPVATRSAVGGVYPIGEFCEARGQSQRVIAVFRTVMWRVLH
jgi:hypothetical protein